MAAPVLLAPATAAGLPVVARSWFHIPYGTNDSTVSVRVIPLGIPADCCTDYVRSDRLTAAGLRALNVGCNTLGCRALLVHHATAGNFAARLAGHAAAYPDEYADNAWLSAMIGPAPVYHGTVGSARVAAARLAFIAAGGPAATQAAIAAGVVHPLVAGILTAAQAAAAAAYMAADQSAVSTDHTTPLLPRDAPWRDPTARQKKILTSVAQELRSLQWKSDTIPQHFFDRIEGALQISGVDPTIWVAIIPSMIPETNSVDWKWVTDYIIRADPRLSWNQARKLFTERYGQQDYQVTMLELYENCRQSAGEPALSYSQRFLSLAVGLQVNERDAVAIHHYKAGLSSDLRRAINAVWATNRTSGLTPNREWNFTSLHELSQLAIQLEKVHNSCNNTSTSASHGSQNPLQPALANPSVRKRTADREVDAEDKTRSESSKRLARSRSKDCNTSNKPTARSVTIPSLSPTVDNSGPTRTAQDIICFRCKKSGHFMRDCPLPPFSHKQNNRSGSNLRTRYNPNNNQQRRNARTARSENTSANNRSTAVAGAAAARGDNSN
jgi:Zinc knuckle